MKKVEKSNCEISKLEEKLNELGYELKYERENTTIYKKDYKYYEFQIEIIENVVVDGCLENQCDVFFIQQDIDNLQQAFNVLQNDLEKLRQIESKENLKECIKALNDNFWD